MITFTDEAAAIRYAAAWTGQATGSLSRKWLPGRVRVNRYNAPGISVAAAATDLVRVHGGQTLAIGIGRITWEILDARAFRDVHDMWREVQNRIRQIWPR